jgi:hypothetical protein
VTTKIENYDITITIKREQRQASLSLPGVSKSGGQDRVEDKLAWTMPNGSHLHEVNLHEAKTESSTIGDT